MKVALLLIGMALGYIIIICLIEYFAIKLIGYLKEKAHIKKMNAEDKIKDLAKRYDIYRKGDNKNDNRKA